MGGHPPGDRLGLGMAAFWIAVIAVIVVMSRAVAGRSDGVGVRSALEVLEERYARGEIMRNLLRATAWTYVERLAVARHLSERASGRSRPPTA
jgi:uncharacterized membrane protein